MLVDVMHNNTLSLVTRFLYPVFWQWYLNPDPAEQLSAKGKNIQYKIIKYQQNISKENIKKKGIGVQGVLMGSEINLVFSFEAFLQ